MDVEEKAYDVMIGNAIVGFTWGSNWGGLVYDFDGVNIVGAIRHDVDIDLFWLDATLSHHTGKAMHGQSVYVSNREKRGKQ